MLSVNFTVQIQFIAVFVIYLGCIYNAAANREVTATATNLSFILIILIIFLACFLNHC